MKKEAKATNSTSVKQPVKVGATVKLLVGKEKGKTFTVKKIKKDRVFLDGYKLFKRTMKLSQENQENYRTVHHSVHISNVTTKIKSN